MYAQTSGVLGAARTISTHSYSLLVYNVVSTVVVAYQVRSNAELKNGNLNVTRDGAPFVTTRQSTMK